MNDAPGSSGLGKALKRRHLFTLGVGTIVGVAWLMVLGSVLVQAGPLGAAIGFVVGAAVMIPIGLCYGELAGALPHAGGEIIYAFTSFGIRWAFAAGLCLALIYVINCVFFAVSVGWLLNELIPGIRGPPLYSVLRSDVHVGDILIGVAGSLGLMLAHWRGAREAARLQDLATYLLLAATCIFVALGIRQGHVENLRPLVAPSGWAWGYGGILSALAVTPYFFGGFNTIPQAIAELEDARDRRRIAGILTGCILVSLLFYCLVLAAVSVVLSREQLSKFELPVAQAFRVAFHSELIADLVLVSGLLGLIAVWNALFFAATRVLYALGRSRLLHPALAEVNASAGAPARAILVVSACSMGGLFLGKGVLLPVVNVTSTLFALMYVIVSFGVLRLRRMRGVEMSGYRVPGGRVLVYAAVGCSLYLLVLSLVQQWFDSRGRIPAEWLLMSAFGAISMLLWFALTDARESLAPEARRRIMLEEERGTAADAAMASSGASPASSGTPPVSNGASPVRAGAVLDVITKQ
jgi:APA family basic amino acid/polyamine antiporter